MNPERIADLVRPDIPQGAALEALQRIVAAVESGKFYIERYDASAYEASNKGTVSLSIVRRERQ